MCNPFKSVKKAFKKVVKKVKKIAPYVALAAAIYYTAGATMELPGAVAGQGAFQGGIAASAQHLGVSAGVSNLIGNAAIRAVQGAAIGGATAALTGNDVGKGLLIGGATGAVVGGIQEYSAYNAAPPVPTVAGGQAGGGPQAARIPGGSAGDLGTPGAPVAPGNIYNAGAVAAPAPASKGLLTGVGEFIKKNPEVSGGLISGLGQGLGTYLSANNDERDAAYISAEQRERELERIAGNYDTGSSGLTTAGPNDSTVRPTPTQQFDPNTVLARNRGARWRFNPESGQVELS